MKRFFLLCTVITMLFFKTNAQPTSDIFLDDLGTLMEDASDGFPKTTGYNTEDNIYGKKYTPKIVLFKQFGDAKLVWQRPMENKYAPSIPEKFYFIQGFTDSTAAGKFMVDSAEKVLDKIAKEYKISKETVKQDKDRRKDYREIEYRANGKALFSITYYLKSPNHAMAFKLFSAYRPGDAKVANLLGCMVFTSNNSGFMHILPVYGKELGDKEDMVSKAFRVAGLSTNEYNYQWIPGRTANSIEKQYEKSYNVRQLPSSLNLD